MISKNLAHRNSRPMLDLIAGPRFKWTRGNYVKSGVDKIYLASNMRGSKFYFVSPQDAKRFIQSDDRIALPDTINGRNGAHFNQVYIPFARTHVNAGSFVEIDLINPSLEAYEIGEYADARIFIRNQRVFYLKILNAYRVGFADGKTILELLWYAFRKIGGHHGTILTILGVDPIKTSYKYGPYKKHLAYTLGRGKCMYTGIGLSYKSCTIDHFIPKAILKHNFMNNIVPSSRIANMNKGDSMSKIGLSKEQIEMYLMMVKSLYETRYMPNWYIPFTHERNIKL